MNGFKCLYFRFVLIGLLFLPVRNAVAVGSVWKPVSWTTGDGIRIEGLYRRASRPRRLTWVLLHGLGSNKEEWSGFAEGLAARGNGVLLYDARGHGKSTQTNRKGTVDYRTFKAPAPWLAMVEDLQAAVEWLHAEAGVPERLIAVGGASLGANVAVVYAAAHPDVPALLLLSPGMEYAGVSIDAPFNRYGKRPLYMAASPEDVYSDRTVQALMLRRKDDSVRRAVGPGGAHGVQMFNDPKFMGRLMLWISRMDREFGKPGD